MERIVIVGGGLAGAMAARALREHGYVGSIVLVCGEPHLPYDRPPLSKAVLTGAQSASTLEVDYDGLGVDLLVGHRATALRDGVLETDGGGAIDVERLVIATGSVPITLPGTPYGVVTLRTIEDSLALRERTKPGAHVVVVGAGFIGAEVATAARAAGCEVTVIEAQSTPLATTLGTQVGAMTVPWYAESGIDLKTETAVAAVEPDAVHLADGTMLAADVVVLGLGARPDTDWLADSGLDLSNRAVVTNERLATAMPGIYAVGDCAAFPSRRYGVTMRVEHWDNALHAPSVVAANLVGEDATWDPVPYVWSEQFGRYLQYAGYHANADEIVTRGDATVCWLQNSRLVAIFAIDRPRDFTQGRKLIEAGTPVDAALLADPDVPVRAAATS
jgi:NADPH-dependent 2,4-dienoyl-CoA reductase/sulfur reductase-like enzyme